MDEKKKSNKRQREPLSKKVQRVLRAREGLEDKKYPLADWKYDVANGDTKLGYADWVLHNIESHEED
jgi:hypothetical protein